MALVGFATGCMGLKPGIEPLAGKIAYQHHGIADRAVGAVGVLHAMQGDGNLVQVAFPINPGGVDKLLIFRHALRRLHVFVQKGSHRLEVDVENAVRLRQQPRRLWRSLGAEINGRGQKKQDRGQYPERSARASVHGPSGIP